MFNNISGIAHSYMSNIFKGISPFDYFEVSDSITDEDIINRFHTYFDEARTVLSIIKPL